MSWFSRIFRPEKQKTACSSHMDVKSKADINLLEMDLYRLVGLSDEVSVSLDSIVSELAEISDPRSLAPMLEAELIVHQYTWPAFDRWKQFFTDRDHFPLSWGDRLKNDPPSNPVSLEDFLRRFGVLSKEARILFANRYWPMSLDEVQKRVGFPQEILTQCVSELSSIGLAKALRSPAERLELLTMQELRSIQKEYGLKGSRSKNELKNRLERELSEEQIDIRLPQKAKGMGVSFGVFQSEKGFEDWIMYEREKIQLYADTLFSGRVLVRNWERKDDYERLGGRLDIIGPDEPSACPYCSERAPKILDPRDLKIDQLPPFHPGCTCFVILGKDSWDEFDSEFENDADH